MQFVQMFLYTSWSTLSIMLYIYSIKKF